MRASFPTPRARRLGSAATLLALCLAPAADGACAHAARTTNVTDSASLHLTSQHAFTFNETGKATGTISGRIYVHLTVTSPNHVRAEVNIYPSGGSITGIATAAYRSSGPSASFSGALTVARGTGRYAHAHGSGLKFTGTIRRVDDAMSVHVTGPISY